MSDTPAPETLLMDGYFGLPAHSEPATGPRPGTIEWLLDVVERHAIAEADALEQYEELARASGDPVIALVMRLILEDEERHHGLLRRIEATLRDALYWTHSPAALPTTETPRAPVATDMASVARALIAEEHAGARKLRDLASREKGLSAGLDSLLLEMMAMDSEKHARLLEFVHDRLASRPRAADRRHTFERVAASPRADGRFAWNAFAFDHGIAARLDGEHQDEPVPHTIRYAVGDHRIDITLDDGAKSSLWWATKNEWLGLSSTGARRRNVNTPN
jgi:rubrerythrin